MKKWLAHRHGCFTVAFALCAHAAVMEITGYIDAACQTPPVFGQTTVDTADAPCRPMSCVATGSYNIPYTTYTCPDSTTMPASLVQDLLLSFFEIDINVSIQWTSEIEWWGDMVKHERIYITVRVSCARACLRQKIYSFKLMPRIFYFSLLMIYRKNTESNANYTELHQPIFSGTQSCLAHIYVRYVSRTAKSRDFSIKPVHALC